MTNVGEQLRNAIQHTTNRINGLVQAINERDQLVAAREAAYAELVRAENDEDIAQNAELEEVKRKLEESTAEIAAMTQEVQEAVNSLGAFAPVESDPVSDDASAEDAGVAETVNEIPETDGEIAGDQAAASQVDNDGDEPQPPQFV